MATQAVKRVRGESPDELAVIAQRALAFTNASGTAIALSEGRADEIICRTRAGSTAPEVGTALRVEGTFTGLCIQSGKELRCDDAETDSRVDTAAVRALGIRSMAVIPIKEEGRVVGVLAVFAPTTYAFTITHVAVLKTMADQIAAYLQRKRRDEAYSPERLPAPGVKAATVSPAASPVPQPAVAIKPAVPASAPHHPVVPKVEPVRATTTAEEIAPALFSTDQKTSSHDEQTKSKTDFQPAFGTPDSTAAPENRLRANVLVIGAAAVVVIAVAVGLSFKLRKPAAAAPPPALETATSPGTPVVPAPASANVQPPTKNIPPAPPEPRPAETVVLSARSSKIPRARDNSVPASDAPAISLGNVPASGSLLYLASPFPQPPRPRVLTQSELEPVKVIKKVPPVYPLVAKQRRLSGSVVVQGTVDKNGRISDLQLISGSPLFRSAAFEALKQWVFQPARLNGQAIEQSTTIRLVFGVQ
jgi:TonB family protein